MTSINISISNKVATVQGAPCIVCGNSDYTAVFTFDAPWDVYEIKTARFVYTADGANQYTDVVFEGDTCPVPVLSGVSEVFVGVYAGNLRTTTPARIYCKQSILCGDPVHADPPPDVYAQLLELLLDRRGRAGSAAWATAGARGSAGDAARVSSAVQGKTSSSTRIGSTVQGQSGGSVQVAGASVQGVAAKATLLQEDEWV